MPLRLGHREQGQTIVFAAIAMVAVVGGLAMVIDTGIFFVVQRQLQSAADAGALAGAWYDPVCKAPATGCLLNPPPPSSSSPSCPACDEAVNVALANADTVKQFCGGVIAPPTIKTGTQPSDKLVRPNVNWIVVTVACDAPYSFGRILSLRSKEITASAAAAIGDRGPDGDISDFTTTGPAGCVPTSDQCRIARLME